MQCKLKNYRYWVLFPARNQHIEHTVVQGERQLAADVDPAHRGPPGLQGRRGARGRHRVDGREGLPEVCTLICSLSQSFMLSGFGK